MSGKDHTYTAVFTQTRIVITVIWQNYNGTELQRKTYNKGDSEPSYSGSTPTRPNDTNYSYTFSSWVLVSSSNNTKTYRAQYTSHAKITVTWQNWNNTTLQTKTYYANQSEPSYSGSTPTRADNIPSSGNGTRYTFSGWTLVSSSSTSKTYRAQFSTATLYIWNRYEINLIEEIVGRGSTTFYNNRTFSGYRYSSISVSNGRIVGNGSGSYFNGTAEDWRGGSIY